jgi:hypothetical protein
MDITAGVVGLLGVAVGYGALRATVGVNAKRIDKLENGFKEITGNPSGNPPFVKRTECEKTVAVVTEALTQIGKELEGLKSYALWDLTAAKPLGKGMDLREAKKLLKEED